MPIFPEMSISNEDIKTVGTAVREWRGCYNAFVTNVHTVLPAGKAIPVKVLDMMTPAEVQEAQRHLDQVYSKISANARHDASALVAQESDWMNKTERYVSEQYGRSEQIKRGLFIF
ncbi:MAG: hypothetical protein EOO80_01530 [Oxalobacteraceae bacterium]|nr:MAG: hypothetical protein EOO80_01530 [Oxalobacteraceae bacterium]